MPQHRVTFDEFIAAPPAAVFPYFAQHEVFGAMAGGPLAERVRFIRRIRIGTEIGKPDGIGSVRRIGYWPLDFEETVITCDEGKLIEYRVSRGSPLDNHHGRIEFHATEGGTRVHYSIEFDPKLPYTGFALEQVLKVMIAPAFGRIRRAVADR
jgi:Polyketide cyclase / dehydrase and lipid transport